MTTTPPGATGDPAGPPGPLLDRDAAREDLWARGRTYATATWTLPLFLVLVPVVVVPVVVSGAGPVDVGARVAVLVLLLGAAAALVRRRGHGVVRGLAAGLLVAVAVLGLAIPIGMLVRTVLT
ncbi:MAG TPA: hypothetical protein VFL46_02450 [Phycicoccus sp.]|nr:hypothetical protein [Phycicoccus sp.]